MRIEVMRMWSLLYSRAKPIEVKKQIISNLKYFMPSLTHIPPSLTLILSSTQTYQHYLHCALFQVQSTLVPSGENRSDGSVAVLLHAGHATR
jgi:hypothetical protein